MSFALPERVTGMAAGRDHLLLLASGRVLTSERRLAGATSDGVRSTGWMQVPLPAGVEITAVSAGAGFSVALARDGTLYTWGVNDVGQLGVGSSDVVDGVQHVVLPSGTSVRAVAAGRRFVVAVTADGAVFGWGDNRRGQQGGSPGSQHLTPVAIALPVREPVSAVAAGADHVVAVAAGQVVSWGERRAGTVTGPGADRTPSTVTLPDHARVVAAGEGFSVAVLENGEAWAWGSNSDGQLGNNVTGASSTPVKVQLTEAVDSVAAADQYVLARTSAGKLVSWGANRDGQLGQGSDVDSLVPQPVRLPAGLGVGAYAVGGNRAFAAPADSAAQDGAPLIAIVAAACLGAGLVVMLVVRHRRRGSRPTPARTTRRAPTSRSNS